MERIEFKDINILDIGNTIQLTGIIWSDSETDYLCFLPDESSDRKVKTLPLTTPEWERLLRQSDLVETEIFAASKDGKISRAIVRKTARMVEAEVSWRVFQRDGYTCRYCGVTGVPMTIDHAPIPWEQGGPSIEANLVSSCKKCNRIKGNMEYDKWLSSDHYRARSKNLTRSQILQNVELAAHAQDIPRKYHVASR